MVQKKLPLINSAHGTETRNIINELIKLFNGMGYTYDEALQKAHDVLRESQKTNNMNKDVQEQIDNVLKGVANPDSEIAQARGPFDLLHQRFQKIESDSNKKSYIVDDFPGESDNEKMVAAFDFMNSLEKEGATLLFPGRKERYTLTSELLCNGKWNIEMEQEISYNGMGIALTIKDGWYRFYRLRIRKGTGYAGWFNGSDNTSVGVRFDNANFSNISLIKITGFWKNVLFENSDMTGSCYNNIFINMLYDSFTNFHFKESKAEGVTVGWNNQNVVYGGSIKNSSNYSPVKEGTTFVLNEGNANTFIGTALEGTTSYYALLNRDSSNNVYLNIRFENVRNDSVRFEGTNTISNIIINGYGISDRILDLENPGNATVITGNGVNFTNNNSYPGAPFKASTMGSRNNALIELSGFQGEEIRKSFEIDGYGKVKMYPSGGSQFPNIEIDPQSSAVKFGHGNKESKIGMSINPTESSDLIQFDNWNFEFRNTASLSFSTLNIPDGMKAIDISKANVFKTSNSSATTINTLSGGRNGKAFYIIAGDEYTTLEHTGLIKLKDNSTRLLKKYEAIHLIRMDGIFIEI